MADRVDCVVVGAGVVGLAVARRLAMSGRDTLILEQHAAIGTETSARNSEVIHAGLHYPSDSLKARLCVAGREQLYEYCHRHGIEHRRCGKLIVATHEGQTPALSGIATLAAQNGVRDLVWLNADEAVELEPELRCVRALLSPSTGIVDSHGLMLALVGDAERAGASLALHSPVTTLRPRAGGIDVFVGGDEQPALVAGWVINAAGLGAVALARNMGELLDAHVPTARFAKGNYFVLEGRAPFSRLVYPVPEPGGLGVHLTLDLGGRARFGPDVEWVEAPEYRVDPRRALAFYDVIRTYWPALPDDALMPGYAGIRPKISGPGEPAADFRIDGPAIHGLRGLVNLFGIESPGLTAALAIGDYVANVVEGERWPPG